MGALDRAQERHHQQHLFRGSRGRPVHMSREGLLRRRQLHQELQNSKERGNVPRPDGSAGRIAETHDGRPEGTRQADQRARVRKFMKQSILDKLQKFKKELQALKSDVSSVSGRTINRKVIRDRADAIATMWVEELRSPLEHKFALPKDLIEKTAGEMKQLHVLSRPNNLKSSYLKTVNATLKKFDDKFILPIKQSATEVESILDLEKLIPGLADPAESNYLKEAVACAEAGYKRAAIVLGWCALIDKVHKQIVRLGLAKFNSASVAIKNQ